jgi:signal transduction histidine kinase
VSGVFVGQQVGAGGRPPTDPGDSRHLGGGEPLPVGFQLGAHQYLWVVVVAAVALLVYWTHAWRVPMPTSYWQMAMFVGLAVAAQHFPLNLTPQLKVDVSIGVYFTCLLLFGPPAAMILVAISRLIGYFTLRLRHHPASSRRVEDWRELLFHTSQLMLATGVGGLVYANLVAPWAPAPLNSKSNLWAIPAVTVTIYLVSGLLAAVMVGLRRRQNPVAVWLSVWRLDALESAGLFLIGLVAAISSIYYAWAPLIMVFPAAGIYLSLRRNLALVEQATVATEAERRRADQAEHLAATLARVGAAADLPDALEAFLRGAIHLLGGEHGVANVFGPQSGEYTTVELVVNQEGRLEKRPFDVGALPQEGSGSNAGSSITVPVKAAGRHIGSIRVTHREPGLFGPTDLALARALAAQAGAAIERARLEAARREAVAARQEALVELARQSEELAKREAEAAALLEVDRLKNEFLSTISHELRTPLTVIDGYSQWLETQAHAMDTPAVQQTADRIHAASAQLVRLIQDLLDFARLQRGEVLVQPGDLDLAPVLNEVSEGIQRQPGGERVAWDVPTPLPAYADGARIMQIVSNLVENAIKYAPEGAIAVRAVHLGAAVRVEVEDDGPGIPKTEHARVWEKFYRAQQVVELNLARGTGIGLAVVKALVEAQRGRVGLESAPGEGSCFWFEVPAIDGTADLAEANGTRNVSALPAS